MPLVSLLLIVTAAEVDISLTSTSEVDQQHPLASPVPITPVGHHVGNRPHALQVFFVRVFPPRSLSLVTETTAISTEEVVTLFTVTEVGFFGGRDAVSVLVVLKVESPIEFIALQSNTTLLPSAENADPVVGMWTTTSGS
tara:strand:- start:9 stop:428 length:420 start_codon:yes stop_codon:yes gene_type:complete